MNSPMTMKMVVHFLLQLKDSCLKPQECQRCIHEIIFVGISSDYFSIQFAWRLCCKSIALFPTAFADCMALKASISKHVSFNTLDTFITLR